MDLGRKTSLCKNYSDYSFDYSLSFSFLQHPVPVYRIIYFNIIHNNHILNQEKTPNYILIKKNTIIINLAFYKLMARNGVGDYSMKNMKNPKWTDRKLGKIGSNLYFTIPKQAAYQLGLKKKMRATIEIVDYDELKVTFREKR